MDENALKAKLLLTKYREGTCTEEEKAWVENWYNRLNTEENDLPEAFLLADLQQLHHRLQQIVHPPKRQKPYTRIAAAAIVIIALGLGAYFYVADGIADRDVRQLADVPTDVEPGGNKAILTLADGRRIVLDDAANGELADESGIKITKTEDGQLVYEILRHAPQARASESRIADARQPKAGSAGWRASAMRDPATYNTIETPKGGQYKIILPDSSVVWLNAASSLRYPTRFDGKERRVELQGEAYFQISSKYQVEEKRRSRDIGNASIKTADAQAGSPSNGARSLSDYWRMSRVPFIVATATQEVTVLGTQFNINAYTDEAAVKTTLLEGKVRVASTPVQSTNKLINPPVVGHGQSTTLQPGEQSILHGNSLTKQTVDVEEFTAWKNGIFYFGGTDIASVMRQLERWYDIEVDYDKLPKKTFWGKISRNVKLSSVLHSMELTSNLKFKIEGRRVMLEK